MQARNQDQPAVLVVDRDLAEPAEHVGAQEPRRALGVRTGQPQRRDPPRGQPGRPAGPSAPGPASLRDATAPAGSRTPPIDQSRRRVLVPRAEPATPLSSP